MAEKRLKTAQLNLRIDPSLKEAAERAAADDHRSLKSLVEKLLIDHLRAKETRDREPRRRGKQAITPILTGRNRANDGKLRISAAVLGANR
jgi:hypothetical protein